MERPISTHEAEGENDSSISAGNKRNDARFSRRQLLGLTVSGVGYAATVSSVAADSAPQVVTIEGNGDYSGYTLATSGTLSHTRANNGTINSNDDLRESTAVGQVGGGRDSYEFTGELVVLNIEGNATATLDGYRIDPGEYFDNVVTINGTGSRSDYRLSASGAVSRTGANNGTINSNDSLKESTAVGQVGGGRDSYKVTGELVVLNIEGNAIATLNGYRVDPDEYFDNVVTINGTGSKSDYRLSVDGPIARTGANNGTINSNDELNGSTAIGQVGGGRDSYKFSGNLTDVQISGDATATLNGDRLENDAVQSWVEKAKIPVNQSDASGGVLDGKLYYFGGFGQGSNLDAVKQAFVYEPGASTAGRWKRIEDLPRALWAPCGVATENAIYSFGGAPSGSPYNGVSPSDRIFRYEPENAWVDLTARTGVRCPYPNYTMGGVYNPDDGLIYCLGGGTNVTNRDSAVTADPRRRPGTFDESRIWTFNPETERVENPDLAQMPKAKRWPSVGLVEKHGRKYIHAIGGRFGPGQPTDTNFRFDIDREEWTWAANAPIAGTFATTRDSVIDNQVYLTHARGYEDQSPEENYTTKCYRYDPIHDEFEKQPDARHRRGGSVSGVIDDTLYVAGGHIKQYDQNGDGYHDCVRYTTAFTPL